MVLRILTKLVLLCEPKQIAKSIRSLHVTARIMSMHPPNKEINNQKPVKLAPESTEMLRINDIRRSPRDTREYRGLLIQNNMKVLLISDTTTDVSAAALSVQVGHMSDPDDIPGLAHFCEHMLFLGTEKYPDENAYSLYLTENAGSSNAATYSNLTKYYFDVAPDKLDEALDRFSQFFIAPLFTETATEREINAVNSEHEKNLSIDVWRVRQVKKHLADHKHPYSKFGTGNQDTLEHTPKKLGINVRKALIKFHKKWYSANMMCLAVLGKETLDELEDMVVSKFSQVANTNQEIPSWDKEPYKEEEYGAKVYITPIKDIRSLTVSFTTEDLDVYYKSDPEQYLSQLIGHEGEGSILSELRKLGWCNELLCGHNNTSRGYGFFDITVDLTPEGFQHIDDIIKIIFQYLKLLKTEGPQEWFFEEYCSLNEMLFRFKEKEPPTSFVTNVVHLMQIFPLEEVLTVPYLLSEWRPDIITELLNEFVPKKCRVIIVGKDVEEMSTEVEPWYSTKYYKEKIPSEVIESWENCGLNENLKLPHPNLFIPSNFDLLPQDSNLPKHPTIIMDSPVIRVWHKQDTEFLRPKTCMSFEFTNPIVYSDPINCNLTYMLVTLFKDQLNEYLYEAEMAGLWCGVVNTTHGINLYISGYSHRQKILLEKVLDHLFNFKVDEQRFDILKEDDIRFLKNFRAEQPYQHAIYYLTLLLTENAWSKMELLDAMKLVTVEKLQHFAEELFSRLHCECFIYGNTNKENSLAMGEIVKKKLEGTNAAIFPLLARQLLQKREFKLEDGESYLFEANNEFHKNSCTEIYLQCGKQTDLSDVFVDLVAQVIYEPCYNILRTKEQLGYIVFSGSRKVNGAAGLRIIVQSSKHPDFVEDRIENFIETMRADIEAMTPEEFERHKNALITQKLEKPKKLVGKFYRYLTEISTAQYHFERNEAEVAILKNITKEEFVNYYKTYVSKDGPARHALCIHIISTLGENSAAHNEHEIPEVKPMTEEAPASLKPKPRVIITDLALFKSSKELYPVTRPTLDIRPKGAKSKL